MLLYNCWAVCDLESRPSAPVASIFLLLVLSIKALNTWSTYSMEQSMLFTWRGNLGEHQTDTCCFPPIHQGWSWPPYLSLPLYGLFKWIRESGRASQYTPHFLFHLKCPCRGRGQVGDVWMGAQFDNGHVKGGTTQAVVSKLLGVRRFEGPPLPNWICSPTPTSSERTVLYVLLLMELHLVVTRERPKKVMAPRLWSLQI